ncbi:hypothetical protein MRX96_059167 [Rhipicephalus microplus]
MDDPMHKLLFKQRLDAFTGPTGGEGFLPNASATAAEAGVGCVLLFRPRWPAPESGARLRNGFVPEPGRGD